MNNSDFILLMLILIIFV